jgi:hypothetical protein
LLSEHPFEILSDLGQRTEESFDGLSLESDGVVRVIVLTGPISLMTLFDEPAVVEVPSIHVDSVVLVKVVRSLEFFSSGKSFVEFLPVTKADHVDGVLRFEQLNYG